MDQYCHCTVKLSQRKHGDIDRVNLQHILKLKFLLVTCRLAILSYWMMLRNNTMLLSTLQELFGRGLFFCVPMHKVSSKINGLPSLLWNTLPGWHRALTFTFSHTCWMNFNSHREPRFIQPSHSDLKLGGKSLGSYIFKCNFFFINMKNMGADLPSAFSINIWKLRGHFSKSLAHLSFLSP